MPLVAFYIASLIIFTRAIFGAEIQKDKECPTN